MANETRNPGRFGSGNLNPPMSRGGFVKTAGIGAMGLAGMAASKGGMARAEAPLPSEEVVLDKMRKINEILAANKAPVRLEVVQLLTLRGGFKYQLHQFPFRIVLGDWWRFCKINYESTNPNTNEWAAQWTQDSYDNFIKYSGKKITFMIDPTFGNAKGSKYYPKRFPPLNAGQTGDAIRIAMSTWEEALAKYGITIEEIPYDGGDHASNACWLGQDPSKSECGPWGNQKEIPQYISFTPNIVFNGWRPEGFFADFFGTPDNGTWAISLAYIWTSPDGSPTDVNFDNYADFAGAEIYFRSEFKFMEDAYNGDLCWGIGASKEDFWTDRPDGGYTVCLDVQWVALHESGHGLGISDYSGTGIPGRSGVMSYNPDMYNCKVLQPQDFAGLNAVFESWHTKPCHVPVPMRPGPGEFVPVTIIQPPRKF